MLVKIAVIVSLCANVSMDKARARVQELQKQNPKAVVTLRLDKKCVQATQTFEE